MKKLKKIYHDLVYSPINRPLHEIEREMHLRQGESAPIPVPWHQTSVVRMNSTFMEFVDAAFLRKGFGVSILLALICMGSYAVIDTTLLVINNLGRDPTWFVIFIMFMNSFVLFLLTICIVTIRLEAFNYTHYPMIFNRKTRMVHVFLHQRKGEILSIPWDDIFFTCNKKGVTTSFHVHGHKLAEDGDTVLETFLLPAQSETSSPYRFLQWEFVRQYMEGDDANVAALANTVTEVAAVDGRRENIYESFRQAWASFGGQHLHLAILFSPLILMATVGRQFAMWTSKKPRWPKEIMDTCQFLPNDPNLRDRNHLAPRGHAKPPDVRPYAGR